MFRMVTEIKEISYDEGKMKWILWYEDNIGKLSNLEFQTKRDGGYFSMGFKWLQDSLKTVEDKFNFYEKTKLTIELIEIIISLGRSRKVIQSKIDRVVEKLKKDVKIYLKEDFSFDLKPIFKLKKK
jgi:hypothetical protein